MKKFKILKVGGLFLSLIILIILAGCEKVPVVDPIDPPVVVTKYTIKSFCSNGTFTPSDSFKVSKGSNVTLNLKLNDGFDADTVIVNGTVRESLRGETTFNFLNIDGDINIEAIPKINKWGLLMKGPWETARWQRRFVSEPNIWELDLYPPIIDVRIVTYDSNRKKAVDSKGIEVEDYEYQFKNDSIFIKNGTRSKVVELSEKILILESLSLYFVAPYVQDHTKDRIIRTTFIPHK